MMAAFLTEPIRRWSPWRRYGTAVVVRDMVRRHILLSRRIAMPSVSDGQHLTIDLGLNPAQRITLIAEIDAHFDIEISAHEMTDADTVGALCALVGRKLKAKEHI